MCRDIVAVIIGVAFAARAGRVVERRGCDCVGGGGVVWWCCVVIVLVFGCLAWGRMGVVLWCLLFRLVCWCLCSSLGFVQVSCWFRLV